MLAIASADCGRVGTPAVAHLVPVRREPEPLLGLLAHLELEFREVDNLPATCANAATCLLEALAQLHLVDEEAALGAPCAHRGLPKPSSAPLGFETERAICAQMRRGTNPGCVMPAAIRAAGQAQRPHRRAKRRPLRRGRPGNAARRGAVAGGQGNVAKASAPFGALAFSSPPHQVAIQHLALLARAALLVSFNE